MQQQPRDFSLHGAVDLGARQAAQRRQATRAPGDGTEPDGDQAHIVEVTDETFNAAVVERSRTVPVVLDLWAEWCGPCKQLGPVLEKLATEADGAWVLAKVDVDANPQLSAALQVQSIPMVVAVVGGQIAEAFLGAMPEAQVREWLGAVMQIAAQLGLPGYGDGPTSVSSPAEGAPDEQAQQAPGRPGADPSGRPGPGGRPGPPRPGGPEDPMADPAFGEAQQAMERGDFDGAATAFEKVLAATPGHPVAEMGLARVQLIRRVSGYDQVKALTEARAHPDDPQAQSRAADVEVATGQAQAGFTRLLDLVRRTTGDERNAAREHLVGLFAAFPPKDPTVAKARATLSSLLF